MDIYNALVNIPELQLIIKYWYDKIALHDRLRQAQRHLEKNFTRQLIVQEILPTFYNRLFFKINDETCIQFIETWIEHQVVTRITIQRHNLLFTIDDTFCKNYDLWSDKLPSSTVLSSEVTF